MREGFSYDILQIFILPIILAFIKPIINVIEINYIGKRKIGKALKCKYKYSSTSKYVRYLIFYILFLPILIYFISVVVFITSADILNFKLASLSFGLVLYVLIFIYNNNINNKERLFITKCNSKILEVVIINATIMISLWIYISLALDKVHLMNAFAMLVILTLEVIGLFMFSDTEIYQYKKAKIVLKDGKEICGVISNSISILDNWFIATYKIGKIEKDIRIPQDSVSKIEYYDKQY